MGKKSPKPPAPPDPFESAQAQAQVNRLNQFFPGGGSLLYGRYGNDGSFLPDYNHNAVQLIESPFQSRSREVSEGLSLQLANLLSNNFSLPSMKTGLDFANISAMPRIEDFSNDAKRIEDTTFQKTADLLRPEFEKFRQKRSQDLSNQGIPLGAEAFNTEFEQLDKRQNDALKLAAQDAVSAGRAEQQRLFANAMAARQSQINDQLQSIGLNNNARNSMLQELASLLGGQQFSPSQFGGSIPTAPIDVLGSINNNYMGQLNAYNSQAGQQRQLLQGLGGFLNPFSLF